jgi:SAM-dependent MidA family methyltransferase
VKIADLPEPGEEERRQSARLAALLRQEIAERGGAIDFSRFMAAALFAPGLGYYSGGRQKFGQHGDFVTAPELGEVFARLLARPCADVLGALPGGDILEAGAGSGRLAAGLLAELERLNRLPDRYLILDVSGELRARQAEVIGKSVPRLAKRVQWLDDFPERLRGVVIANELLDALPVERFRVTRDGIRQRQVGVEDGAFVWRQRPADDAIAARLAPLNLPEGYESEIGLAAEAWVRTLAGKMDAGVALLVDYGFPRAEFYHPQRRTGTLMCHYRQRAHPDPLILPGLQDITAHVDFTAIAQAGREAGLDLLGYTSQAAFLIGCGLESIMADPAMPETARLKLANEINRLTSPAEMGELFKVMALGRGWSGPLRGFQFQDRRGRL